MSKRISYGFLIASILSFVLVSASLVMMAFGGNERIEQHIPLSLICGVVFWICLVLGVVLQLVLTRYVKIWRSKTYKIRRYLKINPQIGIISFFKNPPGMISDVMFVVALLCLIISYWLTGGVGIVCYISLSLLFLTFCLHCIFNGRNYYYIVNHKLIEESYRKKMEESK